VFTKQMPVERPCRPQQQLVI